MNRLKRILSWLGPTALVVACTSKATEPPPNAPESSQPEATSTADSSTPATGQNKVGTPTGQEPPRAGASAPADDMGSEPSAPQHASAADEQDALREEQSAYGKAKPIFDTYCASCHTTKGKKSSSTSLAHFNMDSYPFGGHHAAEITTVLREVLGTAGAKPTMPKNKPGAVKGDGLTLILAWAEAYDHAHPDAGEHEHEHGHGAHEEHDGHSH